MIWNGLPPSPVATSGPRENFSPHERNSTHSFYSTHSTHSTHSFYSYCSICSYYSPHVHHPTPLPTNCSLFWTTHTSPFFPGACPQGIVARMSPSVEKSFATLPFSLHCSFEQRWTAPRCCKPVPNNFFVDWTPGHGSRRQRHTFHWR